MSSKHTGFACECEHAAHMHDEEPRKNTPNGNPGHRYAQIFSPLYILKVRTEFGTFRVCKDCAKDCLGHYESEVIS